MIYGIGNDIIEVARIEKAIIKNKAFKEKVFSPQEIELCEGKSNKYQSYAARFAAKEALMKAFGTGWSQGLAWNEIEVLNKENGAPVLNLLAETKKIIQREGLFIIHISLSHLKEFAIAEVIIEKD